MNAHEPGRDIMQIQVREHNVRLQPDQRARIHRRVSHALREHGEGIDLVTIFLDDVNRGFGSGEKHCRVIVKFPNEPEIYANASHRQMETVIELAAEHIRQAVDRMIRRKSDATVPAA